MKRGFCALLVAALVALATTGGHASAQDEGSTDIQVFGGTAQITVASGASADDIVIGTSSPPRGPRYTCSLQTEGYGQWHTVVFDWSSLIVGETYFQLCQPTEAGPPPIFQPIVWDPADPDGGLGISTVEIRDWIDSNLLTPVALPAALSPDGEQVTGLESWIWPDGAQNLAPRYASAGGLTVGVRARLDSMNFDPGDGNPGFTCGSFTEWTPGGDNPDCSYTYFTEPEAGSYAMWAQSIWIFQWEDNGAPWADYGLANPAQVQDVPIIDLEAVISR